MATTLREVLKAYLETGDTPTQAQFEALLDSVFMPGEDDFLKAVLNRAAGPLDKKQKFSGTAINSSQENRDMFEIGMTFWDTDDGFRKSIISGNASDGWGYDFADRIARDTAAKTGNLEDPALYKDKFIVFDKNQKIGFLYDRNGLDAAKLAQHLIDLIRTVAEITNISDPSETWGKFIIFDKNKKVGLLYDNNGLDVGKLSDHLIGLIKFATNTQNLFEDDLYADKWVVFDKNKKIGLRYDNNGLDVGKLSTHFKTLLSHVHEMSDIEGLVNALSSKVNNDSPSNGSVYGRRNGEWVEIITDSITLENLLDLAAYKDMFAVIDGSGKIGMLYNRDGLNAAKLSDNFKSLINASVIYPSGVYVGDFKADINLGLFYGQSLSPGPNLTSALDFKNARSFVGGVQISKPDDTNINDEAFNYALFGDLQAMPATGAASNTKVCAKVVNDLIESENKKDLTVFNNSYLGYCAGVSGGQWYQLNKQNVTIDSNNWATVTDFGVVLEKGRAYVHLLHSVYFAKQRANAQGKTFNVPYLAYIQGEASDDKTDTVTEYYDKLVELFTDLNTDIKNITGQSNDVHFITYQNASYGTALDPLHANYGLYMEGVPTAHVKMALDFDNVSLGAVLYPFLHANDLHLAESGYIRMSSLMGFVAKRATIDNNKQTTFWINSVNTFSDGVNFYVSIKFNVPSKPIVFDSENTVHGQQLNQGFEILNGSQVDIVSDVRISNDDTIILTCSEDPTGLDITYAKTGNYGGGNVRDSNGDYFTFLYDGTTYRGDNWLPFFRLTI